MEIYGYVYMVRNKINGKIYFGITIYDFYIRYKGSIAKHTHNEHLQNSINTYGIENFEIIEQFDVAYNEDDLWDLEDMYICLYNTLDNRYGYNKRRSGSKCKGHGKDSEETKQKKSEARTERMANMSEEEKKQWSETVKQTWANKSEEEKKQWSETVKQGIANMSEEEKKQHSEATKQGMANMSEEEKKQMSEKMSEARKGDKNPMATKVICLETQQVFTTIKEAQEWFGGGSSGNIVKCCKGKLKSCGKHPITSERLHWMYYKDYLKKQNKENSNNN